jgi:hypothetical protein
MFIPDRGCAYSTNAAVTALPIAADFAFHWSEAMSRYELPQLVSTEDFVLEEIVIRVQSMLEGIEAGTGTVSTTPSCDGRWPRPQA